MWLHELQNTVQMILLINNNKSNSGWQRELELVGHTGLHTKPQSYHLKHEAALCSLRRAGPARHPWTKTSSLQRLDGGVVGTSSRSLLPSGPEDKVPFLTSHDKPGAKQSECPRLCSPLGHSVTVVSEKMDYLHS